MGMVGGNELDRLTPVRGGGEGEGEGNGAKLTCSPPWSGATSGNSRSCDGGVGKTSGRSRSCSGAAVGAVVGGGGGSGGLGKGDSGDPAGERGDGGSEGVGEGGHVPGNGWGGGQRDDPVWGNDGCCGRTTSRPLSGAEGNA